MNNSEQQDNSSVELPLSQESFQHVWNAIRLRDTGIYNEIMNASLGANLETAADMQFTNEQLNEESEIITARVNPQIWSENSNRESPQQFDNLLELDVQSLICSSNDQALTEAMNSENIQTQNLTTLPASCNWKGDYGFDIMFEPQDTPSKSTAWTYSSVKDKLYVMKGLPCPVKFVTTHVPEHGTIIRAMAVFINPDHVHECVKRCLNHSRSPDPSNIDHPAPDHLIRCESPYARYITNPVTGRHSVIVPYEQPHAGAEYTSYIYKYMCWGSCVGGLNRRRVKVIFTLEKDGHCLGRRVLELRICACPGRDRRSDEKHCTEEKQLSQTHHIHQEENSYTDISNIVTKLARKRKIMENREEYTLKVYSKKIYEILKKIKESLELSESITPDILALIEKQRNGNLKSKKPKSLEDDSE